MLNDRYSSQLDELKKIAHDGRPTCYRSSRATEGRGGGGCCKTILFLQHSLRHGCVKVVNEHTDTCCVVVVVVVADRLVVNGIRVNHPTH